MNKVKFIHINRVIGPKSLIHYLDATEVAHSMAEVFGSSYNIENKTNKVIDKF